MHPIIETRRTELAELCRSRGIRRLELFGSAARDDFVESSSDIDFLVQFERGGSTSFRAAFVCRADAPLRLETLDQVAVAWVAKESTSGYLLPRRHLERLGVDLSKAFGDELFTGSFAAALEALIAGKVALTTVFASSASVATQRTGLDSLPSGLRSQLQIIGFSNESPNDSIVAAAGMPEPVFQLLRARLVSSTEELKTIFDADRLVEPR